MISVSIDINVGPKLQGGIMAAAQLKVVISIVPAVTANP